MSEVQAETPVQVTPPPTFGDLEAKSQQKTQEATPPAPAIETPAPKETPAVEPEKPAAESKETPPKEQGTEEKPAPPEKYELKLSENSLLHKGVLDRVAAYAKAQGLSQVDAQSVVKAQEEDVKAFIEDQKAQWKAEVLADKEIGGEALKENITLANGVLEKYGSATLKADLTKSGYGNHPELVRMLVKIGKASANDKAVIPRTTAREVRTVADVMYDNTPKT